jgi:hypothetical protein
MALTNRSRLTCIKYRQQNLLYKQNRNLQTVGATEPATASAAEVASALDPKEKAWKKYLHAKAIYEETRDMEHWGYLQECLAEYEAL